MRVWRRLAIGSSVLVPSFGLTAGGLVACAGLAVGVADAQETPRAAEGPGTISFSFKNAPFGEVIDFFARESGLPVIFEADPPSGAMTFIGARAYPFDEALTILNLNLQRYDRHVRHEDEFLYLSTLPEAAKRNGTVLRGELPDGISPDEILTVTIPLNNAAASVVAEQIKPLLAGYGSVVAVPPQNLLILVETAAQIRRIQGVIDTIDDVRPVNSAYRVFPLQRAKPDAVVNALKGLVGQRIQRIVIDKDGKQRVVEETDVGGLNIQPDPRTRSVIVVGPQARIETVEQLIQLLDAPANPLEGGESRMITLSLRTITPDEAARSVNALFRSVPGDQRPTVLPLPEVGKLTLVGSGVLLAQATALVSEIDPGSDTAGDQDERTVRTVELEHLTARSAEQITSRLLTPRQKRLLNIAESPSGRGLIVAGPTADVDGFAGLVAGIDQPARGRSDVRVIRLDPQSATALLERTAELFEASAGGIQIPDRSWDAASGALTLIGSRESVDRFVDLLDTAQETAAEGIETRSVEVTRVRPSLLAQQLGRLAPAMLRPAEGRSFTRPEFEGFDELGTLIIRAERAQFGVIDDLIEKLTSEAVSDRTLQVIRLRSEDPEVLIERARALYSDRVAGLPEAEAGVVETELDAASGNLTLRGTPGGVRAFASAIGDAQRFLPPPRTTRVVDIERVDATAILEPLTELLSTADSIDASREVPAPAIRVLQETNSLLVTAEDAQHRVIAEFVRRLDVLEPGDLPPLRLLQLRTADANSISQMLSRQYSQRPQAERLAKPVDVRSDPATNTLIVSAHADLFDEIKAFVDDLNKERLDGPERVTVLFPLKVARAVEVATAMDRLYPEPPVPLDRRGRPMPWLREAKEVSVSADAGSNSLIIDAPADRIESLQELAQQLDRVEVPSAAELRTYRVEDADLGVIASALNGLARRGVLSAPATSGKQRVQVLVETEPRSQTLIVAGDEVTFEKVEQILADLSAVPVERELRIVPIASSPADEIRKRALAIYAAQTQGSPGQEGVEVSVDEQSNSLEIVGKAEPMARFIEILEELQRQAGPARQARIIELRFAQASEVIEFLEDLRESSRAFTTSGGAEPVFEALETTNSILVAAQPSQFSIIEQLVRSIDNQETAERPPLRILRLRSTDASNLANILTRSYSQRSSEERAKRPVSIQPDAATNTLVVSAHPEVLPEIEAIVAQLNEAQALDDEDREIRIFPLRVARAQELARTIDAMFPEPPMPRDSRGRPRPDLQQPKEISVRADAATNSLIVDAPARRLAGFEQIVRSLDSEQIRDGVEVRTYRVVRAEVEGVRRTLRELADQNAFGADGRTPVTITAHPMTDSLVVSGPAEIFEHLEGVLSELDSAGDRPGTSLRLYALEHARAERLQPLIEQLLVTRVREATGSVRDEAMLEVAADSASNSLIVSAPDVVQQVAAELIESLDVEGASTGRRTIRVMPLTYADARQVSETLRAAVPTMDLPSGTLPTILASASGNALLLSGAKADLDRIAELIDPLDARPTSGESAAVETFELVHADAGRIAATVQRLLSDQLRTDPRILSARLRYSRGNFVPPAQVRVEADDRTNSLIVSGPQATIGLAKSMIDRLDQPGASGERTAMVFTPSRGNPEKLAESVGKIVRETVTSGRSPVELMADASTGAVVVIGTDEQVAEAVRLLAEFDERTVSVPSVELRTFNLQHTTASAAAGALRGILTDRSRWPTVLLDAERAGVPLASPSVSADDAGNRLLVSAPSALLPVAEAVLESFDAPSTRLNTDVRVFRLDLGDAASVANAVRTAIGSDIKPGEPPVRVSAEPGSNAVIVTGSRERLIQAASIIEELDDTASPTDGGVRTLFLKHARAELIAPIVESVVQRESEIDIVPEWNWFGRYELLRRGSEVPQPVRVIAENRLNALVISGPSAMIDLAEQVASELDVDPRDDGEPDRFVRVLTLENADAASLASNLEAMQEAGDTGVLPATIRVDPASNSLLVRGTAAQHTEIRELAERLDSATVTSGRQLRRISIDRSRADAAEVAETLRRLLGQSGSREVEVISVDELIRRTSEEASEDDSGAMLLPAGRPIDSVWSVVSAVSVAIAAESQSQAEPVENQAADAEPEEPPVTIAVDPETNSLIVVGSERVTERLAALSRELERELPAQSSKIRVIELPDSANPWRVAGLVSQAVRQIGRVSDSNPGGMTGRVSVVGDPSSGSLLVFSNDTDFETVAPLIRSLTVARDLEEVMVKVYPLETISANRAVGSVRDFVQPRPVGRQARSVREFEVTLEGVTRSIDPALVSVTADPGGTSLIITAPEPAFELIDRFIAVIDQSPVTDRMAIRRYELENGDVGQVTSTLQGLFDAQRAGARDVPRARFVGDRRTNTMLVTATSQQHSDVERLLPELDAEQRDPGSQLAVLALENARPSVVRGIVEQVVIGQDSAKKQRIRISADDRSSLFVVSAPEEDLAEIRELVSSVDTSDSAGLPIRTIQLERADAGQVASALERFFRERGRLAGQRGGGVAVTGDRGSGTLVIAANEEDYKQIQSMVAAFDEPAPARQSEFEVVPLKFANVTDVRDTVEDLSFSLQWERISALRGGGQADSTGRFFVGVSNPTNALLLYGERETIDLVKGVIAQLDVENSEVTRQVVRTVVLERSDPNAVASVIRNAYRTPGWVFWRGADPRAVTVEVDRRRRALVMIGEQERVEAALEAVAEIDSAGVGAERPIQSIALTHARADRAAASLNRFFQERARAEGLQRSSVSIVGSREGNLLLVSGDDELVELAQELIEDIDRPELGDDRAIRVYTLANADPGDTSRTVRAMFPSTGRADERVIVTPQGRAGTLIVSAPETVLASVEALINELDAPPSDEDVRIVTVSLENARAREVAGSLNSALPDGLKIRITPVDRSNSLLLTGSDAAIELAMDQIATLDEEPVRSLLEFRRFTLAHADAVDVYFTLNQLVARRSGGNETRLDYDRATNSIVATATSEDLDEISRVIDELDTAREGGKRTEFVALEFADAIQITRALRLFYGPFAVNAETPTAREVDIVSDQASNSLIVSAPASEWDGLRALLKKLDTEQYDTSRQLAVIALKHADARSVASALQDGFDQAIRDRADRARAGRGARNSRDSQDEPLVIVADEDRPTVSAESQTNSLVIFAARRELDRIRRLVEQMDRAEFADYPDARVIPVSEGAAGAIAQSIRDVFGTDRRGGRGRVVIVGDERASALIVRAEDAEFSQIRALAMSLQDESAEASSRRVSVHVVPVSGTPVSRLRETIRQTFTRVAAERGESLAVEIDAASNSLVIATSDAVFQQIEPVVRELEAANQKGNPSGVGPIGAGQRVEIVGLQNVEPQRMAQLISQLGLTRERPLGEPGVLTQAIRVVPMTSRAAVAIVADDADIESARSIVRSLDTESPGGDQSVVMVPLRIAEASGVVSTIEQMLDPSRQDAETSPARAIAEHVRRLSVAGLEGLDVDLALPIRLIADQTSNSVIIASSPANVVAIRELVTMLDGMPVGESIVLRMFPLENASAERLSAVIDELFANGDAIRRIPGTNRSAAPTTITGEALSSSIATVVDERTNSLLVAGPEEAVAFVEVLVRDLDSDSASGWIEPEVIRLDHADAVSIARTLQQVVRLSSQGDSAEIRALRRQVGRLRVAGRGGELNDPNDRVEADLFAPMMSLSIIPDEQQQAIVVVGSTANVAVVKSLVAMLDVEAASASNTVRVFPLRFASADRVAGLVEDVFSQRERRPDARAEDALIVTADTRTNTIVASTSARSFEVLESLLDTLDAEEAAATVGLHVLPVVGADAEELADKIEGLMRERLEAARRSGSLESPLDVFRIESEPATNSLIVASSDENLRLVRELLDALTSDETLAMIRDRSFEVIPLNVLSPEEAARASFELYARAENDRRGEDAVRVFPNTRLNAVLVSGSSTDIESVRSLISRLEETDVTQVREVRRFELRTANAIEVVRLLEQLLSGRSVSGNRGNEQATRLRFFRDRVAGEFETEGDMTEAEIDLAMREQISINAELRTNSVVVTAPPGVMRLVNSIIEDLDTTEAGSRRIEKFRLVNADARGMAGVLQDLFNLTQQGDRLVLVPSRLLDPTTGEPTNEQTLTPVPDERQQLSITIDARTNTLLVSGTDEFLELVRGVVTELDAIKATEREQIVVQLQNASAEEVETTLAQYFAEEADRLRATLTPQQAASAARRLEREVTVVGDTKSQKVLVSASPRYIDTVERIITELDAAPPQVLIQVLLAEVTLDAENQWGLDFTSTFENNRTGGSVLSGGASGAAGIATVLGSANLSVSSDDFGLLVRALEVQGKLEVLSNPQVTVNNNENARIQIGENISLPEDVERLDNGNTRANVRREEVGVIVDVTPSISADGFVRLDIRPEISAVTNRTTQITEDFSAPIISTRSVDTTVTVMDGQTVVIGGLIESSLEERETRVPLLGDIPLLGIPFRSRGVSAVKTELLVILTPKIIPGGSADGVEAYRRATQDAINRTTDPERLLRILPEADLPERVLPIGPRPTDGSISPVGPYAPGLEPDDEDGA